MFLPKQITALARIVARGAREAGRFALVPGGQVPVAVEVDGDARMAHGFA